ncbi:MAG: hypothetical protein WCI73_12095 [Phycisphaerae bacterium]
MSTNHLATDNPKAGGRLVVPAVALVAAAAGVAGGWYLHDLGRSRDQAVLANAQYDDSSARQVDAKLLTWREVGSINTKLANVKGMALLAEGGVAVVGERTLRIWWPGIVKRLIESGNATTEPFQSIALSAPPTAVAVGSSGIYYVAERDRVELFEPTGQRLSTSFSLPKDAAGNTPWITCIAVTDQAVYLADAGRRVVVQMDHAGHTVAEFGRKDESKHAPGLIVPSPHLDVAVIEPSTPGGEPTIWISNPGRHQLEAYNPQGDLLESWGKAGTSIDLFTGCCNPTDFALLKDGRFVTAEKGTPRVKIYSADGQFESVVAGPDTFGLDPAAAAGVDVAVDRRNRIWVMDPARRVVRVYEPKP